MADRIRAWWAGERAKLSALSPGERAAYIWDYYRLWIIGFLALVLVAALFIHNYMTTRAENWFFACFANTTADLEDGSPLWQDFADYAGYDLSRKNLHFDARVYFDPSRSTYSSQYYHLLVAYLDSSQLDVLVMEPDRLQTFGAGGRLMDLEDERMSAVLEKYGDRILSCTPSDGSYGKTEVAIGIDLSGSRLTGETGPYPAGAALGVNARTEHPEQVEVFLDFLFQGDGS